MVLSVKILIGVCNGIVKENKNNLKPKKADSVLLKDNTCL